MDTDYDGITCDLTFDAGVIPPTTLPCAIEIINDQIAEFTEDFSIQASSLEPRATFSSGGDTAVVNIIDDPPGIYVYHNRVTIDFRSLPI